MMDLRCSPRRMDEEQGTRVVVAIRIVGSSLAANNLKLEGTSSWSCFQLLEDAKTQWT
jgi:hypothetical protein